MMLLWLLFITAATVDLRLIRLRTDDNPTLTYVFKNIQQVVSPQKIDLKVAHIKTKLLIIYNCG